MELSQYGYSLKFSIAALLALCLLMLILLKGAVTNQIGLLWLLYGFIGLVFVSLGGVLVVKRLLPAIQGDIALQLDEAGISDFIKDVSIGWGDIKKIQLIRGRSAAIMLIELKWESDYGREIAIYLRWIKGKDSEIYETTLAHFKHFGNN